MAEVGTSQILAVNDQNLAEFVRSMFGVLILSKTDCGACIGYEQNLNELISVGKLRGVVIGKMNLDIPGSGRFKRDNPWIAKLDVLPHTLLFRAGIKVAQFATSKGSYLLEQLEDAGYEAVDWAPT